MCPCGHERLHHDGPKGPCHYGRGNVFNGCSCAAFRSGRYREHGDKQEAPMAIAEDPRTEIETAYVALAKSIDNALADFRRRGGIELPVISVVPRMIVQRAATPALPRPTARPASGLSKCERAVLTVLAQHGTRNKVQVAILAGYSHSSGGYRNALSALRSAGFIHGSGDALEITATGGNELGAVDPLPSGKALLEYWMQNAGGKCERLILGELAAVHPRALPKEAVANRTGYQVTSGGFRNALSRLRTLQLIRGRGELAISETLAAAS